jgi:hypothetical protein
VNAQLQMELQGWIVWQAQAHYSGLCPQLYHGSCKISWTRKGPQAVEGASWGLTLPMVPHGRS